MFNFFKKKNEDVVKLAPLNCNDDEIVSIVDGKLINITTVPDATFAGKIMGDGVAFVCDGDSVTFCSPANGKLEALFPTGHAYGIKMNNGVVILVHIGINTVEENGKGFEILGKSQGDVVKAGEPIVKVDMKTLREKYDMSTMLIVTDTADHKLKMSEPKEVKRGDEVIVIE